MLFVFEAMCGSQKCEEVIVDTEEVKGQCCLYFKNEFTTLNLEQVIQRSHHSNRMHQFRIIYPDSELRSRNTNEDINRRKDVIIDKNRENLNENNFKNKPKVNEHNRNVMKDDRLNRNGEKPNDDSVIGTKIKPTIPVNQTTEGPNGVENITVEIGNRNNVDVPEFCPNGFRKDYNGECQEIFK